MSNALKAHLAFKAEMARRIRTQSPAEWNIFSQLWMAFNAIYGGEPDLKERARVMASIRSNISEQTAARLLRGVAESVERILQVPPGDMRLDRQHPNFRANSKRYARRYRDASETAVNRLAAVGAVLYQIRCNLLHGSKDPFNDRDLMLVHESVAVLEALVPALEASLLEAA
ncbi:hypothetical protein OOT46_02570 [Aquabacterium sp. A7-Y]|uniref:hypothetical protein n=1 Tax=Aquabacterium sp. A7-Y TaxID=1349605 RepID=UPI00223CF39B|nr:hypothetical protein [Aquabacterium sp. A7-Y]MCW7536738.1 hypothetical protein [Aquabacterium sp. A7-Y]